MKNINTKKGFTIIEVVLVLAIAGLIFLMVFVALPNLQISQRDTQRRDDVAKVTTALTQYQSNNGGRLPEDDVISAAEGDDEDPDEGFRGKYLTSGGQQFTDPLDGTYYAIQIAEYVSNSDATGALDDYSDGMYVAKGASCGIDGELEEDDAARAYAVVMKLEGAGYYCANN